MLESLSTPVSEPVVNVQVVDDAQLVDSNQEIVHELTPTQSSNDDTTMLEDEGEMVFEGDSSPMTEDMYDPEARRAERMRLQALRAQSERMVGELKSVLDVRRMK